MNLSVLFSLSWRNAFIKNAENNSLYKNNGHAIINISIRCHQRMGKIVAEGLFASVEEMIGATLLSALLEPA